MVVQHNLAAMNSNRMLGITTGQQSKSSERLSSGYKINRAADDAAGLTISEKMRKQIRGLTQASTNAQDGVSCVQTAEGALTEVHAMLQRMNELAVQSANGTNSQVDRDAVQAEVDQLITEIDRVAETTKFNETYLLKGDAAKGTKTVYSYKPVTTPASFEGLDPAASGTAFTFSDFYAENSSTAYASEAALLADLQAGKTIYKTAPPTQAAGDAAAAGADYTAVHAAGTAGTNNGGWSAPVIDDALAAGTYKYNNANGQWEDVNGNGVTGITVTGTPVNNDTITVTAASVTKTGDIYAAGGNTPLTDAEILAADSNGDTLYKVAAGPQTAAAAGTDYNYTPAETNLAKLYDENGKEVAAHQIDDYLADSLDLYADRNQTTAVTLADLANYTTSATVNEALVLNLHVGADSTLENKISVEIESMSAAGIGVTGLKVDTEDTATAAIDTIAAAIQQVSSQRSALGAVQNRLEHTIANLDNVVENTTAAESRIRDTDMAKEMVEYSKNNILAQAGQSMLAQANNSNQGVLSLLQ